MIDTAIEVFVNLFQSFMFIGFLYLFFDKHENKVVRIISLLSAVLAFFATVNFFTFNPEYVVFNESIVYIGLMEIYTLIFLRGNVFVKLIMPVVSFVINVIISFSLIYLISFTSGQTIEQLILESSVYRYFLVAMVNITNVTVLLILLRLSKREIKITKWTDAVAFIIVPSMAIFIIYCTFLVLAKTGYRSDIMLVLMLICLSMVIIAVIVWLMISRISKDNDIKTKLLLSEQREKLYEENVIQTNAQIEKVEKVKHDMKNNLMCIGNLISENNLDEAKRLCNYILTNLTNVDTPLNTANPLLNAIVNVEHEKASAYGIEFITVIKDELRALTDTHEIVSIIGNLCDNAIEYLCTVPDKNRQMRLEVTTYNNYYIITCKNKILKSVLAENPLLESHKEDYDIHGKGVSILKSIAEKYEGDLKVYEENDFFCSSIIIKTPNLPEN